MREQGVSGTPEREFKGSTTDSDHVDSVAPNLLKRNVAADRPDAVWVGDITYLRTVKGWVYLAVLIDLHSRKVVGWALEEPMRQELCLQALSSAVSTRQPPPGLIQHTDRGSQYTSAAYHEALDAVGAVASMRRKGNCWDNAVSESFFGTLKQELVGPSEVPADAGAARAAGSGYLRGVCNVTRRHSTLGYPSPVDVENVTTVMDEAA